MNSIKFQCEKPQVAESSKYTNTNLEPVVYDVLEELVCWRS